MKIFGRIVLGLAIVAVAAIGGLWMLVGLKEVSSLEELPFTIAGLLAAVGLAVLWWYAVGRSLALAVPMWLILALPGLLATQQTLSLGVGLVVGLRLEREAVIESYAEEPITWPGFDGPVGMTMRFDLIHPDGTDGLILGPEIRMGPALDILHSALHSTLTSGSGYFKDTFLDQNVAELTLLKPVLFQRLYVNPQAEQEYQQSVSSYEFATGTRTSLAFHLHPEIVDYLVSEAKMCLTKQAPGVPHCRADQDHATAACLKPGRRTPAEPVDHQGDDLSALWTVAIRPGMTADLSATLTAVLRGQSRLQGDAPAWSAIQRRLEPAGLTAAGYGVCPPAEDSHTANQI
jgi:hypothetical protein